MSLIGQRRKILSVINMLFKLPIIGLIFTGQPLMAGQAGQQDYQQLLLDEGEPFDEHADLHPLLLGPIKDLAFSHDGRQLASVTADGTVCLWSLALDRPTQCMQRDGAKAEGVKATALAFSPLDLWIAAGYSDGSVGLWRTDGKTGSAICQIGPLPDRPSIGRAISSLVFSPDDGSLWAIGSRNGTARVCRGFETEREPNGFSTETKPEKFKELPDLPSDVFARTAQDLSARLVAAVTSHSVGLWDVTNGTRQWLQEIPRSLIEAIAVNSRGGLATGSFSGAVDLWDLSSGTRRPLKDAHTKAIRTITFSPDGKLLAGSDDRDVLIWDTGSRRLVRNLQHSSAVTAVAFHPGSVLLASATTDGTIGIWDVTDTKRLKELRANADWIRSIAFSHDGALLATASDDQAVRIWRKRRSGDRGPEWSLGCIADELNAGVVHALSFRPFPSQQLAVASKDKTVRLLNTSNCALERDFAGHDDWVRGVSFSPDGKWLASGSDDGFVRIWDADSGEALYRWAHGGQVRQVKFVPFAGKRLASVSTDKTVRLWEVGTEHSVWESGTHSEAVTGVAFRPHRSQLAALSGSEVWLWDIDGNRLFHKLVHEKPVTSVEYSPDGAIVATASVDGKIRLWEADGGLSSGSPLETAWGDAAPAAAYALAFSPGGETLAAASLGRLVLWSNPDRTSRTHLWQAGRQWASWTSGQLLFRNDSGGLLWRQRADRRGLEAIGPPLSNRLANLTIVPQTIRSPGDGSPGGEIVVHVSNAAGAGPAYWLHVDGHELPGGHDLRDVLALLPSPSVMRLDPGASIDLVLHLSLKKKTFLPPHKVHFCLTVPHAQADPDVSSQSTSSISQSCTANGGIELYIKLGPWIWRNLYFVIYSIFAIVIFMLLTFVLIALQHRRALRNPLVQGILSNQDFIRTLPLANFSEVREAFRRVEKFRFHKYLLNDALNGAGISPQTFQRILGVLDSPRQYAGLFAERIAAKLHAKIPLDGTGVEIVAFEMTLPQLPIYVDVDTIVIICTGNYLYNHIAKFLCKSFDPNKPKVILLIDNTDNQQVKQVLNVVGASDAFVVFTEEDLRRIFLLDNTEHAKEVLIEKFISQCSHDWIAPYQERGNELRLDQACFFFGRQAELGRIIQGYLGNFFLVGPRFMGKSSLLNKIQAELSRLKPNLWVLKCQLYDGTLVGKLRGELELESNDPAAFYDGVIRKWKSNSRNPLLFLIDEADLFIEKESKTGFPFCNVIRALNGDGQAYFIFTGFRKLHEATRTPDHPLRNFGELIRLGPLDTEAAQQMILKPMEVFRINFSDPAATVQWLLDQSGCRPLLLARACAEIIKKNTADFSMISLEAVQQRVLGSARVREEYEPWEQGSVNPVDRAVMRAALLMGRPLAADILRYLADNGLHLRAEELEESLSRLYTYYYMLIVDSSNRLYCPVGLYRYWLTNHKPVFPGGKQWNSAEDRLRDELTQDIAEAKRPPPE